MEKRKILMKNNDEKSALDKDIQSRLLVTPEYRACGAVMIYSAREHEISTSMIIHAALANGKTVALPRCEADGVMRFFVVTGMSDLAAGRFGILEPVDGCAEYISDETSLCVCPALSCDMSGRRLGFGGGYYDRFLKDFKGVSAALCYSDAFVPTLPHEEHDVPVDMIVTDRFVKRVKGEW